MTAASGPDGSTMCAAPWMIGASSAASAISAIARTASTGWAPTLVSAESITAEVPSMTALATSVASARVGSAGDDHRLEHLRGRDDELARLCRAEDRVLLHERHARDARLDAVVAARDHHAVGRGDDLVEVLVALDLLDLRDRPGVRAAFGEQGRAAPDVGARADERQRDEVGLHLDGDVEVLEVLLRDRGKGRPGVGDGDPLARAERAARDDGGRDGAVSTRSETMRGTPSPMTISERSVTRSLKPGKSTAHVVGRGGDVAARERDLSPTSTVPLLGLGRQSELRALEVEHQRDGRPARSRRLADVARPAAEVVRASVRAVEPGAVQAGLDELVEDAGPVRRRAEGRHDLGVPREHARECYSEPAGCVDGELSVPAESSSPGCEPGGPERRMSLPDLAEQGRP